MLAIDGLAVGALLTSFGTLSILAFNVISNVQRGKERERDYIEARNLDREGDLAKCKEELKALETAYDLTDRRYVRLLRERDEGNKA